MDLLLTADSLAILDSQDTQEILVSPDTLVFQVTRVFLDTLV